MKLKLFKNKYLAILLLQEQDTYEIESIHKINPSTVSDKRTIKVNKQAYDFDISKPSHRHKRKRYYFIDIVSKKQLFLIKPETENLTTIVDKTENDKVVEQIVNAMDLNPFKISLYNILLGIFIGVFGCLGIMSFF